MSLRKDQLEALEVFRGQFGQGVRRILAFKETVGFGITATLAGLLSDRVAAGSRCLVLYPRPQARLVEFRAIEGLKVGQLGSGEPVEITSCFSAKRKLVVEGNPARTSYDFILMQDVRPMERSAAQAIMGAFPKADVLVTGLEPEPAVNVDAILLRRVEDLCGGVPAVRPLGP